MSLRPGLSSSRSLAAGLLAGVIASIALVLMAWTVIDHVPLYDELLHYLSGRGLLSSGAPVIADGVYERALLFTQLVAAAMSQWGETLVVARLPALFGAILLAIVLAVWITRQAGFVAGVCGGLILILVPTTLELAVFIRFYTLHALLIVLIAMLAYAAVEAKTVRAQRIGCGLVAVLLLAPAWHFQETTAIAAGAVILGVTAVLIFDHWPLVCKVFRGHPWKISLGLLALMGVAIAFVYVIGFFDRLASAPLWAAGSANRPQFYLLQFAREMPLLWPLFPLAAIVALRAYPRFALYCLVILLAGFAVHSFAAAKSSRYVYYLLPFYAAVWACSLAGLPDLIRSAGLHSSSPNPALRWGSLAAMAALILGLSQEGQRAARTAAGKARAIEVLDYAVEADWSEEVATLQPIVQIADRIVTSNAMKSIYYLGRYDYELNVSIVEETETGLEFGRDIRTGHAAIGTAESIATVLGMPGLTLVVLETEKIDKANGVPVAAMAVIAAHCTAIELATSDGIRAWQCGRKAEATG